MTADVVVSGLGQLNRPNIPDIPGLERFAGTTFHSARWDHDHDLRRRARRRHRHRRERHPVRAPGRQGRRQLTLFQRSVNYVAPKPDRPYRPWERWLLEHVPAARRAYRASIYWRFEARFALMRKGNRLGQMMQDRFGKEVVEDGVEPTCPPRRWSPTTPRVVDAS